MSWLLRRGWMYVAMIAVCLAGTIFFNVPLGEARGKVALEICDASRNTVGTSARDASNAGDLRRKTVKLINHRVDRFFKL